MPADKGPVDPPHPELAPPLPALPVYGCPQIVAPLCELFKLGVFLLPCLQHQQQALKLPFAYQNLSDTVFSFGIRTLNLKYWAGSWSQRLVTQPHHQIHLLLNTWNKRGFLSTLAVRRSSFLSSFLPHPSRPSSPLTAPFILSPTILVSLGLWYHPAGSSTLTLSN